MIGVYQIYRVKLDSILYNYTVHVWAILSEKMAIQKALSTGTS